MDKKKVVLEGSNFCDIQGFYTEIDRILTKDLTWKTGHNLNAFNDLLRGGFGVHEYEEPIILIWKDAEKSKNDLGYEATVKHYEKVLESCHPTSVDKVNRLLKHAKQKQGNILFEILIEIIQQRDNIELIIEL